jgi:cobaltochelatase CobS
MATRQELEKRLKDLTESLDAVPAEFKDDIQDDIQKEIDDTRAELAKMQTSSAPASDSNLSNTMLQTLLAMMKTAEGSGADSASIRAAIKKYLQDDKVGLSELDQSVLDEIKKNQLVVLEIPNFSQKIEVSSAVSKIPNLYDIVDDVLAGNNVYLIGEAGGGKTYTAEQVAKLLKREYVTLNCSQYTSPLEILGGQSIEGFKEGKLIDCWKNGKILILDEMPKLDSNTAGLFNDALAKSSKTRPDKDAKINSANAEEPPIERNPNFAVIATGNIYPNEPPAPQYRGNNQQDLSLLDRFSGSVYYTEFDKNTDEATTRFKFLYDFLVGNYYEFIDAKSKSQTLPPARGLRTVIENLGLKNLSLVSYRTNISFRVAFEYELVRAIAKKQGKNVSEQGKTLAKTFKSYMVAFASNRDTYNNLITQTGYNEQYINNLVNDAIESILKSDAGFLDSLNPSVRQTASPIFQRYQDFYVSETVKVD